MKNCYRYCEGEYIDLNCGCGNRIPNYSQCHSPHNNFYTNPTNCPNTPCNNFYNPTICPNIPYNCMPYRRHKCPDNCNTALFFMAGILLSNCINRNCE